MSQCMISDKENSVDPTVQTIVEMFPEDFLRNTARETGVVERERKIDVVILFWVTTLGFGVRFLSAIRGLKRKYEEKAKTTLSISSFYDRFTPEMVDFLRKCVLHAIEFQAQQTGRVLDDKLKRFNDLVIQDSTIIRLHESLAKIWPAARTKKIAAGVKVSCIVSAVADSPKSVRIYPERTSEAKILRLGPWLRDRILLIDLGYFKYLFFDRIDGYGGYFVSRLKGNANPLIVGVNRKCQGNSVDVAGKKLRDVLPRLKREILDVEVEVEFKRRKYKGKQSTVKRRFRMVCAFNSESGKYHSYLTNIRVDILSAEEIALLYGARWEIELIFKELKSHYRMDQIQSANPDIVRCLIWVAILTLMCSRRILRLIRNANPENANRYTHLRWAKVFTEQADRLLTEVLECMGLKLDMLTIYDIYLGQGCDPNVERERLMERWVS
nr:transposase [uncultured archaeon GZfos13E1]